MNKPRGETDHCRYRLLKYCKGQGLDLGCGNVKIKTDAIGVDLYNPTAEMHIDARDLSCYSDKHFDYIYSSHLLEEIGNTEGTLNEWLRVLKDGGYLVLYQADPEYYYPLGDPACNQAHKHHFTWDQLWAILEKLDTELVHHERYNPETFKEWSFELVVKKKTPEVVQIISEPSPINFKVMVVGGPAEAYVEKCLESLMIQDYPNWKAQVVIDPVGDNTYNNALKFSNDKISIKLNEKRVYNISNFLEATKLLQPQDDDIMVMLDADDWLAGPQTLSIVKSYYEKNPDLLVSHGSWHPHPTPTCMASNGAYSEDDFVHGVRRASWRASHLRTCKYKIWKNIRDESLRGPDGNYFTIAGDLALMYPMLEMAGYKRVQYIPEVLYIYNHGTPFGDEKLRYADQKLVACYISNMPSYEYRETF